MLKNKIHQQLRRYGVLTSKELAEELAASSSGVSRALKQLQEEGMARRDDGGRG